MKRIQTLFILLVFIPVLLKGQNNIVSSDSLKDKKILINEFSSSLQYFPKIPVWESRDPGYFFISFKYKHLKKIKNIYLGYGIQFPVLVSFITSDKTNLSRYALASLIFSEFSVATDIPLNNKNTIFCTTEFGTSYIGMNMKGGLKIDIFKLQRRSISLNPNIGFNYSFFRPNRTFPSFQLSIGLTKLNKVPLNKFKPNHHIKDTSNSSKRRIINEYSFSASYWKTNQPFNGPQGDPPFISPHFKYKRIYSGKLISPGFGFKSDIFLIPYYKHIYIHGYESLGHEFFGSLDFSLNRKKSWQITNELGYYLANFSYRTGIKTEIFKTRNNTVFLDISAENIFTPGSNNFFPAFSANLGMASINYPYKNLKHKDHFMADTTKKHEFSASYELMVYLLPRIPGDNVEFLWPSPSHDDAAFYWSFYHQEQTRFSGFFVPFINLQYQTTKKNRHIIGTGYIKNSGDWPNPSPYCNLKTDVKNFNLYYQYQYSLFKKRKFFIQPDIGLRFLFNKKSTYLSWEWGSLGGSKYNVDDKNNKELVQLVLGGSFGKKRIVTNFGLCINMIGYTWGRYNYYDEHYNMYGNLKSSENFTGNYDKFLIPSDFSKKNLLFNNFFLSIGYRF